MPKEAILATAGGNGTAAPSTEKPPETPLPDQESQTKVEPKIEVEVKPWTVFLETAKNPDIKERFTSEVAGILANRGLKDSCTLALFEPEDSIDSYDLDKIFTALSELNPNRSKDVMLFLLSRGGSIEPAYQISKLCKSFANKRFIAVVRAMQNLRRR